MVKTVCSIESKEQARPQFSILLERPLSNRIFSSIPYSHTLSQPQWKLHFDKGKASREPAVTQGG